MKQLLVFLFLTMTLTATERVATAIPALKEIGDVLLQGTDIEMVLAISDQLPLNEYVETMKAEQARLDSLAPSITAVLSLRSIMPEDYLFIALRQSNIRIVEIDAAHPLNPTLTAVGTIRNDDGVNPYIWTSPNSVIRSTEIIGKDLIALFPSKAEQITANIQNLRTEIRVLKSEYDQKFLALERFEVAVIDNAFDYLLMDINLFVTLDLPSELQCTEDDLAQLRTGAEQKTFSAIVNGWIPFGEINTIAKENGVSFALLNKGVPGFQVMDNGIVSFLRNNLEAVYQSLQ